MAAEVVGSVSEIWRFPVKSMGGERIADAGVSERGVRGDRAFALLDVATGKLVSAKRPRLWGRMLDLVAEASESASGAPTVAVRFPDGTTVSTDDPSAEAALSRFFGREVALVDAPPSGATFDEVWDEAKADSPLYAQQVDIEDGQPVVSLTASPVAPAGTLFDFSAIHLVTAQSLEALRSAYPDGDVDVRRFRPNLVIDAPALEGFPENEWVRATVEIGERLTIRGLMTTMRCAMTTLAQPGLPEDRGILHATNRANRVTVPGMGDYACLGLYCRVMSGGPVREGDEVRLVR